MTYMENRYLSKLDLPCHIHLHSVLVNEEDGARSGKSESNPNTVDGDGDDVFG